jgi:hypothetical protein
MSYKYETITGILVVIAAIFSILAVGMLIYYIITPREKRISSSGLQVLVFWIIAAVLMGLIFLLSKI